MKKIFSLIAALAVVFTLASCGKKEVVENTLNIDGIVSQTGDIIVISPENNLYNSAYMIKDEKGLGANLSVGDKVEVLLNQLKQDDNVIDTKKTMKGLLINFVSTEANNVLVDIYRHEKANIKEMDLYFNGIVDILDENGKKEDERYVFIDEKADNYYLDQKSMLFHYYLEPSNFKIGDKIKVKYLFTEDVDDRTFLRGVHEATSYNEEAKLGFTVVGMDANGIMVIDGVNTNRYYVKGLTGFNIGDTLLANYKILDEKIQVEYRYKLYECTVLELTNEKLVVEADKNKIDYEAKVVENKSDYIIVELDGKYYELIPELGFKFDNKDYKFESMISFKGSVIDSNDKSTLTYNGNEVGIIKGVYYVRVK